MNQNAEHIAELEALLERLIEGDFTDEHRVRLNALLALGPELRRFYRGYMKLHHGLQWQIGGPSGPSPEPPPLVTQPAASPTTLLPEYDLPWEKPRPKVVIETSLPTPLPWYSVNSPIGLRLIANAISAILILIGIGIASVVYVSHDFEIAATRAATSEEDSGGGLSGALATAEKAKAKKEKAPVVGHISGMVGCRWADPSLKPIALPIRQGTKFALESGLMEITYTTGAKVILQGPCTYEVESPHGGYLALGKLTAKVASGQWRVASAHSPEANPKSEISKSPNLHISKFVVRTPTALITDLGTEFGVEVFDSGESHAHVFQGKVEVRLVTDNLPSPTEKGTGNEGKVIVLAPNQSVRIGGGKVRMFDIAQEAGDTIKTAEDLTPRFVREMPRWVPIKIFSTGIGLKEGDADPHWQIVARSDQPDFQPCQAVVTKVSSPFFLANDPEHSQWISLSGELSDLPNDVIYTFRTTFELEADVAILRGWYIADNRVRAVRLNGNVVESPDYESKPPFNRFRSFTIKEGFVVGKNTLEIDVENGSPRASDQALKHSPMLLRIVLDGAVLTMPSDNTSDNTSPHGFLSEDRKPETGSLLNHDSQIKPNQGE